MQISQKYACRTDLDDFQKRRFTIEDRIEQNLQIRAFYRWSRRHDYLDAISFAIGIVPLAIAFVCDQFVKVFFGGCEENPDAEKIGFWLFVFVQMALFYFVLPVGLGVLAAWIQFAAWVWFVNLMHDYNIELERHPPM